ncbi:hypothetical protein B6D60_01870, partial [candidate division KSB1 bacterium 4484_87]
MRAPNVIKDIPLPLVRAMPTLYYYGCFATQTAPPEAKILFSDYLKYFQKALILISEFLPDPRFEKMVEQTDCLTPDAPSEISHCIYKLSLQLSQICQQNKERLQQALERRNLNESLRKLFDQSIEKRSVLV